MKVHSGILVNKPDHLVAQLRAAGQDVGAANFPGYRRWLRTIVRQQTREPRVTVGGGRMLGMRTLLDPPPTDELVLLRAIADSYAAGGGRWPVWQYVVRQLDRGGIDAAQTLTNLPTWKHHYRYVTGLPNGRPPNPDENIHLTAAGMFHARQPDTNGLLAAFLAALTAAVKAQRSAEPMPTAAVSVVWLSAPLITETVLKTGMNIAAEQLYELLQAEPATWKGFTPNGESWQWDVTQLGLHRYRNATTAADYLAALETVIGEPAVPAEPLRLSPLALPDALDHLDLAWQLVTNNKLVSIGRAGPLAAMTQPASTREEFESRCSGLADLLNNFTTAVKQDKSVGTPAVRSLQGFRNELGALLGDKAGRAQGAVDVLRHIVRVRAGQQHPGAGVDAEKARNALRLNSYDNDWPATWEHIRAEAVQALTTIREEISSLLPR